MNGDGVLMDEDRIRELLAELGERLDRRGIQARLFLVGGAAMALAYNNRRSTVVLDAVFEPKSEIYAEAAKMADEYGLPVDWINDGVKGLLPDLVPPEAGTYFDSPGISVGIASPEYLFAMKAMAAREEADADDIKVLAENIGLTELDDAVELVERYYSARHFKPVTQYLLADVLDELAAERAAPPLG